MKPLELTRSGIAATLVILVVVVACVRLGIWQLDRRGQKLERNRAVAARMAAGPIQLTGPVLDTAGLVFRSASVAGSYDHDRTLVLAGRSLRGAPGVHVFTPLRIGEGAILVNRGWMHAPDAATVDLGRLRRPESANVGGVLAPFPDVRVDRGDAPFHTTWFRLDGEAIRAQYPYSVAPLYLIATNPPAADTQAGADGAGVEPVRLDPPVLDAGPHLSYAVQWFSFAAIFAVGWAVMVLRSRPGGSRVA